MGREQLLPHLLVINLLLLFLQKGERLFVANSMPILLKHLMLRNLVLMVFRSLALGPRSLRPRAFVRYRLLKKGGNHLFLPSLLEGG